MLQKEHFCSTIYLGTEVFLNIYISMEQNSSILIIKVRVINFERKATHYASGHGYAYEKNFKEFR